jgi:hypothetical protein
MSTVEEITEAIQKLSPAEREKLAEELPLFLPELNGDAVWERIIRDPRPRPALTSLVDGLDAEYQKNPRAFPEMTEDGFERQA